MKRPQTTRPASSQESLAKWRQRTAPFIWALLAAFLIRTLLFQPFSIPSSSMAPTLLVGDHLFVAKYAYGYSRYALPSFMDSLAPNGRILGREPKRGDVIVFRLPNNDRLDYIKRVVGLPGDRVQIRGGVLYINGSAIPRESLHVGDGARSAAGLYRERLPMGASYEVLDLHEGSLHDTTEVYRVPEDHVFVMGDNRDNSTDSRALGAVGYIPLMNIVGRASRLYISVTPRARWFKPWDWGSSIRWERMGLRVHRA